MGTAIEIVEVGPRDGLQNEDVILSTEKKLALIDHLIGAGLRRIEAVSFAHPGRVPQMADAEAVMAGVPKVDGVSYIGLVMNWRGWMRAVETTVDEVNMPVMTTATFNQRNQGVSPDESVAVLADIVDAAADTGIAVSGTISASWGCPFEGEVPVTRLVEVAEQVVGAGVVELSLADTIGVADPWAVTERITAVRSAIGDLPIRVHFHDTRNTGIANTAAAIDAGVTIVDASVGGIGGCPFAPAATGNIATDDLVYMLDRAGFDHGTSLGRLIDVSHWLEDTLGKPVPAMLPKAGRFPTEGAA
ncbi:MAG: hydroxymethylglutaryl-CoA lyase [Acidimicrobiia bacterium]|nr:hydroxymethylglutaryl-CoA lyase [Acidimicrobiia bacterium]